MACAVPSCPWPWWPCPARYLPLPASLPWQPWESSFAQALFAWAGGGSRSGRARHAGARHGHWRGKLAGQQPMARFGPHRPLAPPVTCGPPGLLRNRTGCVQRHRSMHASRVVVSAVLVAVLAGCGVAAGGGHGRVPGSEVTVSGSSATPDPSASGGLVTVTEADNGATVRLRVGQRLHVVLAGSQWRRPASSGDAMRLSNASGGYPTRRRADAVFLAIRTGTASVSSITDYPCLHAQPPCKVAQRIWSVQVTVHAS